MASAVPPEQADHGLGREVVDPSTVLNSTYIVEKDAEALKARQGASTLYWVGVIAALILLTEQIMMNVVMYTPVLPKIAEKFQTGEVVWMLTAFTLAGAVIAPVAAKLADVYGKRRILLVLGTIVAAGSTVCTFAPNFTWLIIGRIMMGAMMGFAPIVNSMLREILPARMRAMAIALAANGMGFIVVGGPIVAGWISDVFGVQSVFIINMVIAIVTPLLVLAMVPESPLRSKGRVDYPGAVLLGVAVFGILFGVTELQKRGFGDPMILACLLLGVVALLLWWVRQRTAADPLVNLRLLKQRSIYTTTIAGAAFIGVAAVANFLVSLSWSAPPEITSYGMGLSAAQVGYWSAPAGIGIVIFGAVVGWTARAVGYRTFMIIAGIFWTLPSVLLALNLGAPPAVQICIYAMYGLANVSGAASVSLLLLAAPGDQRGIVIGLNGAVAGIVSSMLQQIIFAGLGNNVETTVMGVPLYSAEGFKMAFLAAAAAGAIGLVVAILIPHGRRVPKSERAMKLVDVSSELVESELPASSVVPLAVPTARVEHT